MDRVIVTGSSGFVGRALGARLGRPFEALRFGAEGWREAIGRADFRSATVFHLAARVHRDEGGDEAAFQLDNVEKTRELALAASAGGARRLVFLSTVKVHGEETAGRPFRAGDAPHPGDAYARSKLAAEEALAEIARRTGLEVATVRAPLVFGAGAKGNLASLLRLADSAWPLPFASIANRRSFVHVDDLARLLILCAESAAAANGTFLAAHAEPFSTPRLVAGLRASLGRAPRLFAFPPALLEAAAGLAGRGAAMRRLTRSLEVDAGDTTRALGWRADAGLDAAVADVVAGYRSRARS
ncbi:MAG TPA: NAD-dependent epimerase/dehydratase family protein [Usitatibacter sp.]|nr:NAD-dependent epimerase/dehydratase family protein [Usitatibacter sp.]